MMFAFVTLKEFLVFVQVGLVCGLFYDLFLVFKLLTKNNILVVNVLDFLFCLVSGFLLIYCIFKFENGGFTLFELISFVFGVVFEQIIIKNLWTSPIKWVYNKVKLRKVKKNFSLNNYGGK